MEEDKLCFRYVEFQVPAICTTGDILVGNWIWTQERDQCMYMRKLLKFEEESPERLRGNNP